MRSGDPELNWLVCWRKSVTVSPRQLTMRQRSSQLKQPAGCKLPRPSASGWNCVSVCPSRKFGSFHLKGSSSRNGEQTMFCTLSFCTRQSFSWDTSPIGAAWFGAPFVLLVQPAMTFSFCCFSQVSSLNLTWLLLYKYLTIITSKKKKKPYSIWYLLTSLLFPLLWQTSGLSCCDRTAVCAPSQQLIASCTDTLFI